MTHCDRSRCTLAEAHTFRCGPPNPFDHNLFGSPPPKPCPIMGEGFPARSLPLDGPSIGGGRGGGDRSWVLARNERAFSRKALLSPSQIDALGADGIHQRHARIVVESVVVDDQTGEILHVGAPGYRYRGGGLGSAARRRHRCLAARPCDGVARRNLPAPSSVPAIRRSGASGRNHSPVVSKASVIARPPIAMAAFCHSATLACPPFAFSIASWRIALMSIFSNSISNDFAFST
jgi:hypothetical protein